MNQEPSAYYVYVHHVGATVFYVGHGLLARATTTNSRNPLWRAYVEAHGPYTVTLVYASPDKVQAGIVEWQLITALQPCCNIHGNAAMHRARRQHETQAFAMQMRLRHLLRDLAVAPAETRDLIADWIRELGSKLHSQGGELPLDDFLRDEARSRQGDGL